MKVGGHLPVHTRFRSLARWMLKEFRQPLGGTGCEPGRNWPSASALALS
ncbi:hypothetical protein [Desulfosporosinus sp.]|nr:hypothetical protein [Desulfosporosinus sp.]MDA8221014.1 hypothetical protein [Desulfitobacterium hafniense]